jgi:hypothetical protein
MTQKPSAFAEPEFSSSHGLLVAPLKDALVVRFFCAEQVVNNSSEFVSRGRNCLGPTELPRDAPKELSQVVFGVMQRVRSHAESSGNSAPDTAALGIEDFAAADLLLRAQSEPGRKGRRISELGDVCGDLAKDGLGCNRADAGTLVRSTPKIRYNSLRRSNVFGSYRRR